jgi:hypothetical protein
MTEELEGLGPRARAAVATLIAMALAAEIQRAGDDDGAAIAAIDAMKRWIRGEPVSGREMSDLVYSERGEGVALHTMRGAETSATPAWSALTIAAMYVAWHAYQTTGERMPEDVSEVDESTLDMLDEHWRATRSYDPDLAPAVSRVVRDRPEDRVDVDAIAIAIGRG